MPQISETFWGPAMTIGLLLIDCHLSFTTCPFTVQFPKSVRIIYCYLLSSFCLVLCFKFFFFTIILVGLWKKAEIKTCINLLRLSRIYRVIITHRRLSMHCWWVWDFFWGWWNIRRLIVVMVAQLCKHTKNHWILYCKQVNYMVFKLHIYKVITVKKQNQEGKTSCVAKVLNKDKKQSCTHHVQTCIMDEWTD